MQFGKVEFTLFDVGVGAPIVPGQNQQPLPEGEPQPAPQGPFAPEEVFWFRVYNPSNGDMCVYHQSYVSNDFPPIKPGKSKLFPAVSNMKYNLKEWFVSGTEDDAQVIVEFLY